METILGQFYQHPTLTIYFPKMSNIVINPYYSSLQTNVLQVVPNRICLCKCCLNHPNCIPSPSHPPTCHDPDNTAYCYVVVPYKASHTVRQFSDLLCVPIWVLIIPDSYTRALWQVSAETRSTESGETWREMAVHFADEISLSYSSGFFNVP
jgi:hypothetical protein